MRPVSIGYGEDADRLQHQSPANDRRPLRGAAQSRRAVRPPRQGAAVRRRAEPRSDGRADARGLPSVRLHVGRQVVAAVSRGLSQDVAPIFPARRRLSSRRSTAGARRRCSCRAAPATFGRTCPGYPYRCGDEADIRWTGRSLGCAAVRAADRSAIREEVARRPAVYPIRCATSLVTLPGGEGGRRSSASCRP